MYRLFILTTLAVMLFSCNAYKIAEKHINKKMNNASMTCHFVQVGADSVEYWDSGSDKPIFVLVHGFGATTKYQWYKQVEELSQKYRVIMPNLLYFGNTKVGEDRYKVADQVDMVKNFITKMGIKNYVLGGVSYGGLISLELARKYPSGIEKLIIVDAPARYMYKKDLANIKETFDVPSIEELFAPSDVKGLKKLMRLGFGKRSIIPASWLTEFYEALYAKNLEDKRKLVTVMVRGLEEYQTFSYAELTMPVLLVWGSTDQVIPADRGRLLQEHIGNNARYEVIKKGAHMPAITKDKKFNTILLEFLEEK